MGRQAILFHLHYVSRLWIHCPGYRNSASFEGGQMFEVSGSGRKFGLQCDMCVYERLAIGYKCQFEILHPFHSMLWY